MMPKQFNACQIILITASGMTTGKTKQQQQQQKERKKEKKRKHTHTHTIQHQNFNQDDIFINTMKRN